jgi:hypothetical protein
MYLLPDFGERIPTDVVYFDGSDPVKMHNYYTYLYNKAVFEVLKEVKGENEAVLFARTLGYCRKPEVPGPLGRRLFRGLRIHGGKPQGRLIIVIIRVWFLES